MKKLILALVTLSLISCNQNPNRFSILHYNIKELSTEKLHDKENKQLKAVKEEIEKHKFDILSINEIQYDFPGVPSTKFQTEGLNLKKLGNILGTSQLVNQSFVWANTGKNAKKNSQGEYYQESRTQEQRALADQVNFGVMPAQYSTGALYKFKKKNELVIRNLLWKEFNPQVNFSEFRLANGSEIPEGIELFDKSFSDSTILINNKEVHLILLHTVTSYHFGNKKTVNYLRNKQQLDFLKWYINLDGQSKNIAGIDPLKANSSFIIIGDLNVDINSQNPGAKTLEEIVSQTNTWIPREKMNTTTYIGRKLVLDYIITSKNIKTIQGKIIQASEDGSDHLPLWGEFEIN